MYIYIRSMSETQSKVYDSITSHVAEMNKHIIKLLLYPDCRYVSHWQHEIYSFLNSVPKLKNSNKFPKANFILKALSIYDDMLDAFIEPVIDDEPNLEPRAVLVETIQHVVQSYHEWLASELSSRGVISQNLIRHKLAELVDTTL